MRFIIILSAIVIGISALVVLQGGGSEAAWPGDNGRILYSDEVNGGIWIMDASGGNRQPVTTGADYNPSWSPDASRIVFEREAAFGREADLPLGAVPALSSIWTVEPDGTDLTQVGTGTTPSWSPDGTRIVYSFEGWIREMNADGTGGVQITQNESFWDTAPVYRLDGSLIAFLRRPFIEVVGGPGISGVPASDIWTTDPDGLGVPVNITNTPGEAEGPPDWSPAGDKLTYTNNSGLVVSTFPGNVPQTIFPEVAGAFPEGPVFSPDGTTIAFTLLEPILVTGGDVVGPAITPSIGTIYTIPAAGGSATVVPGSVIEPEEFYPDWEPVPPPTPTPSPSPTPSPTPTPSPSPTPAGPTPIVRDLIWGDDQCDNEANPIDSLITLRSDAGLSVQLNGCPNMGLAIEVLSITPAGLGEGDGDPQNWGNVDCDAALTPVDSLKILRYDAGLSVLQQQGCPPIGDGVQIQYAP